MIFSPRDVDSPPTTGATMMLSEANLQNTTVQVPPWLLLDESAAGMIYPSPVSGISVNANGAGAGEYSPLVLKETFSALQCYLPSSEFEDSDSEVPNHECDSPVDGYSCDEFRMYEFKVRRCSRGRSHDWTECPYAHPGEKARRRDPRKYHYSGTACPDFRKGNCKRGDSCEFAHGVFECWLHPARYRTQPCKDGTSCRRRVCFFAHTPQQLRVLPQQSPRAPTIADSYDGSPLRQAMEAGAAYVSKSPFAASSPTSTLMSPPLSPPSDSPPLSPISPSIRRSSASSSVNEVLTSLRQLQLSKAKSAPASWGLQFGSSPRGSNICRTFHSLPSTPTAPATNIGWMDGWDRGCIEEEPISMERVESGKDVRARMYEKLSKENAIDRVEPPSTAAAAAAPDVGWVSELVM